MEWNKLYPADVQPSEQEINAYMQSPLWDELRQMLANNPRIRKAVEYSKCSEAPGWNIKYKRCARAVCTVYPKENGFICMIAIGRKEKPEFELLLPGLDQYVQDLYANSSEFNGTRWLMIDVTSEEILENVKQLIALRLQQ